MGKWDSYAAPENASVKGSKWDSYAAPIEKDETPQTGINWDTMGKNVKSLVGGTRIGEQLPIIGEPIRRAGTARARRSRRRWYQ